MNKLFDNRISPPIRVLAFLLLFLTVTQYPASALQGGEQSAKPSLNQMMIRRTQNLPPDEPIRIVFCADLHIPFDDRGTVSEIAKKANELNPAFVLLGGDTVQVGNKQNFSSLMKALKKFNMPVISAIGNHDTAFDDYSDQAEWSSRFGDSYYFLDAGPVRVIALNNANFDITAEQIEFLKKAVDTDLRKIIIMHRPVNYLNPLYSTPIAKGNEDFRKIVEEAGVIAVLTGHEHHYAHYEISGVNYIVSGGAGGALNQKTENNFHHFILMEIGPDSFNFKVVKI